MTPREKTLALLAEAGAQIETKLIAHNVNREVFDALPGDAKLYASSGTPFWAKQGKLGGLEWRVYTLEPASEQASL